VYGFLGLNNTRSSFKNITIPAPALNISAYNDITSPWVDPRTAKIPYEATSYDDPKRGLWYYAASNETFTIAELKSGGNCQPTATYKWGFSFLILFICLLLTFFWSVGTYILWLKAHLALRNHGEPESAGDYKAIIELAAAMNNEFAKHDENVEFLRERQIQGKVKHIMNGGTMWYDSPAQEKEFNFWDEFKEWAKRDKWWWPAYLLSTGSFITGACLYFPWFMISLFVLIGTFVARTVGQTGKSRCLIVLFFLLSSFIPMIAVLPKE